MQRFKLIFLFIFSFALGALIWGIGFVFLEKKPLFFVKADKDYKFFRIDLAPLFFKSKNYFLKKDINALNLNSMSLKAVYKDKNGGFIILEDNKKSVFLDLNQTYKGYKLTYIGDNFAIFNKSGKNYKISFKKNKNSVNYKIKTSSLIGVKREIFKKYKNNLSKIWKNIGIVRVKEGYKITYIKKNSIFEKIGLKKGDILLEVNGRKLKNDADAWDIYKNADKINNFEIKIKRKNQIKVLNYEIY